MKHPIMKKTLSLLIPVLLFVTTLFAGSNPEEEAALNSLILSSTKELSDYHKTKNKSAVLRHFHEKMVIDFTYISISGKVRTERIDFNEMAAHLEEIAHNKMGSTHDVEIMRTFVTGDIGVVSFTEDYEMKYGNEVLNKGSQLVTATAKKFGHEWKIIRMTVVEVENEKIKGTCLCELYSGEGTTGNYIAKTTAPGGKSYNSEMMHFSFRKEDRVKTIVKMEDTTYLWENSFAIWTTNHNGDKEKQVGQAASEAEVIKHLIGIEFKDHCTELVLRK
ncbi:MAG: hypothetical protein CMO01_08470 [Thalassobius sp.]|nr:hypothetical protein [Thalassovita sp.]